MMFRNQGKKFIEITEYSNLSPNIVRALDDLIESSPPGNLKNNVIWVYHQYLMNCENAIPHDFDRIAADMFFLVDFITIIEKELSKSNDE